MWLRIQLAVALLAPAHLASQATPDGFAEVRFLEGRWAGETSGQPGKGTSERIYSWELRGRYLYGKNRATYPKPGAQPEVHEDWSFLSFDRASKELMLRQFHVEGFVNEYSVTNRGQGLLEFTSFRVDGLPEGWRAREVYRITSKDEFTETFSLAQPGKEFQVYSETRFRRAASAKAPYPPSPVIRGVKFDWRTHHRAAQGSDNWQLTWADDGHLYGAWGDGGGFGGTNSDGRVSLGVARIEGDPPEYKGVNVWGGKNGLRPAAVDGKSWGMVAVDGVLYMWVVPGSPLKTMQREARLYRSRDHGLSWEPASWAFTGEEGLTIPTICQFGKNYEGARDGFVYHYLIHPRDTASDSIQRPGTVYLARSPKHAVMERSAYEFFAGMESGRPRWTRDTAGRRPVFEDANGVGWVLSVSYNAGLKRYILMTDHSVSNRGNLGIFDAPEPWGPWTTGAYLTEADGVNFGRGQVEPNTFFWNMPTKWQSADGQEFVLVFTGSGRGKDNDSFNLVRGRFELGTPVGGSGAKR